MPGAGHLVHMPAHIYPARRPLRRRLGGQPQGGRRRSAVPREDARRPATTRCTSATTTASSRSRRRWRGAARSRSTRRATSAKAIPPRDAGDDAGHGLLRRPSRCSRWCASASGTSSSPSRARRRSTRCSPALWLHAHGMALAATGKLDEARARIAPSSRSSAPRCPADLPAGLNPAKRRARARRQDRSRRASPRRRRAPDALALWAEAVALEDRLAYSRAGRLVLPGAPLPGRGAARRGQGRRRPRRSTARTSSATRTTAGRCSASRARSRRRRRTRGRRRRRSSSRGVEARRHPSHAFRL